MYRIKKLKSIYIKQLKKQIAIKLAQGQNETTGEKGKNIALIGCSFHLRKID